MTSGPDLSRARPHDLGGQPAGRIDRTEHEAEPWQNLVTALMYLLRHHCHSAKTDEMRRAIEDLKPEEYRRLGYFDKWAIGISTLVVEKELMTPDEIVQRVGDIAARLGAKP
jgi:hypothetical protein